MNETMFLAIVQAIILFVGITIFLIGISRKGIQRIIIGASIIGALFIFMLIDNPEMANALSAFSTIALAFLAAATLLLSYQARKDAREKDDKDRKERLLEEAIE